MQQMIRAETKRHWELVRAEQASGAREVVGATIFVRDSVRPSRGMPNRRLASESPNRERDRQPDAEPVFHELRARERERQVTRARRRQRDHSPKIIPLTTGRSTSNRHLRLAR